MDAFSCSQCGSVFRKAKHLRYHKETVHCAERQYACDQCGNSYKRSSHLKRHVQNAHSAQNLICPIDNCGKVFNGPEQLRKHVRRHETKGSHPCELCGKAFSKKRQLESHLSKIHGPFVCGKCGLSYSSRSEYRIHAQSHTTDVSDEPCMYCDAVFPNKALLRQHLRSHKSFSCTLCGSSFTRERSLRSHIFQKHSDSPPPRFACEHCGVGFSTISNLNAHIRVAHRDEKLFTCELCEKQFGHKHVWLRHLKSVHGIFSECEDEEIFSPEKEPVRNKSNICEVAKLPQLRVMSVVVGPEDLVDHDGF